MFACRYRCSRSFHVFWSCVRTITWDAGADKLLQDGRLEISPVILVAGLDRVVEHHEAGPFMQGAGDKQRESEAVKLGLAEHGDDIALLPNCSRERNRRRVEHRA